MIKYTFEDKERSLFLAIEEDVVGWYLIVYSNESRNGTKADYLQDTLQDVIGEAEERFGVAESQWKEV